MSDQYQQTTSGGEMTAVERDRQLLIDARAKGGGSLLGAFVKLSGPGWLQSAITLGGGSLSSALFLGVLGGMAFMWLQPLAMIMGVIMLSSIAYVTLSTGEKPFRAINRHVNPVLGWGWIIATMLANLVWCLPQYSLGTAAVRQNLMPDQLSADALSGVQWPEWLPEWFRSNPDMAGNTIVVAAITLLCVSVVIFYDKGRTGIRLLEWVLKGMVGIIVISFVGVVVVLSLSEQGLDWNAVWNGFVPNLELLSKPAASFDASLGAVGEQFRGFWSSMIVDQQRDVMIGAAATAVGINMTFLLPYSMLKKGWDRNFRGLAMFDLSTGLFIPFILVTGCVVIASAAQFHNKPAEGVLEGAAPPAVMGKYEKVAAIRVEKGLGEAAFAKMTDGGTEFQETLEGMPEDQRDALVKTIKGELGKAAFKKLSKDEVKAAIAALPEADRRMAAMLVKRDAFNLAQALAPLTGQVVGDEKAGKSVANYVFGVGVVGMAISSIIVLMLINGFVATEVFGTESRGWLYRFGALLPAAAGLWGPFIWSGKTQFWLAVPTSVFGFVLMPIAYFTFYLMMNQKSLLGEDRPRGIKRLFWNLLMFIAAGLAGLGSLWVLWNKGESIMGSGWYGMIPIAAFVFLAVFVQIVRKKPPAQTY